MGGAYGGRRGGDGRRLYNYIYLSLHYIIIYTYRYTVTTRMTPVLRWAAMSAILNVSLIVRDKVTRQCPLKPQTFVFSSLFFFFFEEKGEPKRN